MKRIIKILNDHQYQYAMFDQTMVIKNKYDLYVNLIQVSKSLIITYDFDIQFKDEFVMPIIVFCNEYNRFSNIGCMEYDYASKQISYSIKNNIMDIDINDNYFLYLLDSMNKTISKFDTTLKQFNEYQIDLKQLLETIVKE